MQAAFIASEYNPFHNGHQYHINETRKYGADAVICIMSGNFVQRGDIAIAQKHIRAHAAVLGGADLVIELPLKYAISTVSYFARGFTETAKATGLNGFLSFGAENSLDELFAVKDIIYSDECEKYTSDKLSEGVSYPAAKSDFVKEFYPEVNSQILNEANNILSLEYLKSRDIYFPDAGAFAVRRKEVSHDSFVASNSFASASYLRNMIYDNTEYAKRLFDFAPKKVSELYLQTASNGFFPSDRKIFERIALSRLLFLSSEDYIKLNNINGGIENRILTAVRSCNSIEKIYDHVKSKHLTHSRIRQIILSAVLGVTKDDLDSGVNYLRVLAFNNKGREVLHEIKKNSSLPLISNLSQIDKSNPAVSRDAQLDYYASKLFNLCIADSPFDNPEYEIPPVYVNE